MISLGVLLVILGVGSLLLPYFGLQFTLMDFVNDYQPWIGIIVAALGLITILFGAQRRREAAPAAVATAQTTPPPPPAETSTTSETASESRERSDQP